MTESTTAPETPEKDVAVSPEQGKQETQSASQSRPQRGGRGGRRGNRRTKREPKEFEESILQIDRVTRVTKGGRQLRFRISVVIGDKKGRVGFGIGKSSEVVTGIQKAVADAKRNLVTVPSFDGTISQPVKATFKSSQVTLFPAPKGKGVIAGGAVRKILDLSGVKDVLSKIHGSRNRINVAYATMAALGMLRNEMPGHVKKALAASAKENVEGAKKTGKKAPTKTTPKKKAAPKKAVKKTEEAPKAAKTDKASE